MTFAIRGWFRRLHIHNGFYRFYSEMQHSAAASSRGDGERELAAAMAAVPVLPPTARLEGIYRLLVVVVQKCHGVWTSKDVNLAIRNMRYTGSQDRQTSEVAADVIQSLVQGGLAEVIREEGRSRKGRSVQVLRWKPWAEIQGNAASNAFREHLGLGEGGFS